MYHEIEFNKIDLNLDPPIEEPERQYYYIAKCQKWVKEFEQKQGRLPKACVTTFGCPVR